LPDPVEVSPVITTSPSALISMAGQNDAQEGPVDGAGNIFLKAALWDLGIFSQENIKETDWDYYLTYSKGIRIALENNKSLFIDFPLPLERCIREVVDGLVNNVKPFLVHKISDEELFKAGMEGKTGFKISNISVVDCNDHILLEFSDIMELNRKFITENRVFVENNIKDISERAKGLFFPQHIDNIALIDNILSLKGFESTNKEMNIVTLLISDDYDNKKALKEAMETLNGMYLRDEHNRLVSVKIE
jgi:hypothetical protein